MKAAFELAIRFYAYAGIGAAAALILAAPFVRRASRRDRGRRPPDYTWHVWDEELEAEMSETERQMAADPVDRHFNQVMTALTKPAFGMAINETHPKAGA